LNKNQPNYVAFAQITHICVRIENENIRVDNERSRCHDDDAASSAVGELLEPVGRLEVVGHELVEPSDHLVDGLLPRLLAVFLGGDRQVELSQRRLHDEPETFGHLPRTPTTTTHTVSK